MMYYNSWKDEKVPGKKTKTELPNVAGKPGEMSSGESTSGMKERTMISDASDK